MYYFCLSPSFLQIVYGISDRLYLGKFGSTLDHVILDYFGTQDKWRREEPISILEDMSSKRRPRGRVLIKACN